MGLRESAWYGTACWHLTCGITGRESTAAILRTRTPNSLFRLEPRKWGWSVPPNFHRMYKSMKYETLTFEHCVFPSYFQDTKKSRRWVDLISRLSRKGDEYHHKGRRWLYWKDVRCQQISESTVFWIFHSFGCLWTVHSIRDSQCRAV